MTKEQLAEKYGDSAWAEKLAQLFDLVSILQSSIIGRSYKISDELNEAITLSKAGISVRTRLTTKKSVPTKEANLLTFLALVHHEPLVDVARFDFAKFVSAVSTDIRAGNIKFPMIFGRELYDRAAELFPERKSYLRHDETIKLLEEQPQGVFQSGKYVVGPYGIILSEVSRNLAPTTRVALQHCHDLSCGRVHPVQFSTSIEAPVNKHRPALNDVLDEYSEEAADWTGYLADFEDQRDDEFDLKKNPPTLQVLGDCLSEDELRIVFSELLDKTSGRLRAACEQFSLKGDSAGISSEMSRAEMLQLSMTLDDASIVAVIDDCVKSGRIMVPNDEIRTPRLATFGFGNWDYIGQIGPHGFRAKSSMANLPLLRLAQLCRTLYAADDVQEQEALDWALREVSGETSGEKLEEFLRTAPPDEIVRKLVFSRVENLEVFIRDLRIDRADDDSMLGAILWKLGFSLPSVPDARESFWRLFNTLESTISTAAVNPAQSAASVRAVAANYFVALEEYLYDALLFATWALLNDHVASDRPFEYQEGAAREVAMNHLAGILKGAPRQDFESNKPTLSTYVHGFSHLAAWLEGLIRSHESYLRDQSEYPDFVRKTDVQGFPFVHRIPFLDLTPQSKMGLISSLRSVAKMLTDSMILDKRNTWLHARSSPPDSSELRIALDKSRSALEILESVGLVRKTFSVSRDNHDSWGRRVVVLNSGSGNEVSFSTPSYYQWVGLPNLRVPQYLVHGAVFSAPNAMLRFQNRIDSEYTKYWADFPKRRVKSGRISFDTSLGLSTPVETGEFVGSRAD